MREAVERLREKAQNEKTVIGLSDLLRLANEEIRTLRASVARLEEALNAIMARTEHGVSPEIYAIAHCALEEK